MKKFLSLVLAMIMTMSLVTISVGATEYKDLTDKDEIQYEEAVAVLNRIGVITGYEDGTFRPETELTRGAAAKIIVSLMIGPEAATALPNNTSPYPDVPAGHTFAGVISYCKTAEYISGYSDGNFKPAGTLTGYAFAKMLLGALGYKSDIEGFSGYGWTNNVAKIGNVAELFNRISFDGAAAVTRDQACQLALNTLKATTVTYGGNTIINGANGSFTMQNTTATPRTSNNRDINANIGRKDWYGGNNQGSDYLTLEFGEEHFKDLRLEHDKYDPAHDEFGRPSNEWSYKKVTIGTFPLEADFTYTTQVAHIEATDSTKEKALGLRNYDLIADGGYSYWGSGWDSNKTPNYIQNDGITNLWLNGKNTTAEQEYFKQVENSKDNKKIANIADFTDNGTLVEVYVSNVDADWITDVVVIQTQLMEVEKVASDYVALKRQDTDNNPVEVGYNQAAIDVEIVNVKDSSEEAYAVLKDLKVGDDVAIVPVTRDDGKSYEASEAYVPETVSGTWTRVDTYGKIVDKESVKRAVSITVGGTEYKVADWNAKMIKKTNEDIKATRTDVTLLMDKYGNALKAKGIGDTTGFMVIGNYYQNLVNGKISTFVHGWDINGKEIDLNLGSNVKFDNHNSVVGYGHELGELVQYSSSAATGDADYALIHSDVHSVFPFIDKSTGNIKIENPDFETKTNSLRLPLANVTAANENGTGDLEDNHADHFCNLASIKAELVANNADGATNGLDYYTRYTFADDVKFIYVNYSTGEDEIDSVEFKNGRQNVSNDDLQKTLGSNFIYSAQASVDDGKITSVVIKRESSDASLNRMLYVINYTGFDEYDRETGKTGIGILAARFTADGKFEDEVEMIVDKQLKIGSFAIYTDMGEATINGKTVDHHYHVKNFNKHNINPAVLYADKVNSVKLVDSTGGALTGATSDYLLRLSGVEALTLDGRPTGTVLVGDPGNDGVDANDATDSYVMSDWRSHGSVSSETFNEGAGIIWTSEAQWLNVYDGYFKGEYNSTLAEKVDKIDSTKKLNKFMEEENVDVAVTILLNENPTSDDFRVAYLIIIEDVKPKTAVVEDGVISVIDADGKPVAAENYTLTVNGAAATTSTKVKLTDTVKIVPADGFKVSASGAGLTATANPNEWTVTSLTGLTITVVADDETGDHFDSEDVANGAKIADAKINSNGDMVLTMNVEAPEFAAEDATTSSIGWRILDKKDGVEISAGTFTNLKNGTSRQTIPAANHLVSEVDDPNWIIELVEADTVVWSKVKVKYTINGVEATAADIKVVTGGTLPTELAKDASIDLAAKLDNTVYATNGNKIKVSEGATELVAEQAITVDGTAAILSSTSKNVSGTGAITYAFTTVAKPLSVTGLTATALNAFTNKTGVVAADNTKTLTITASSTPTATGARVDFNATLSDACDSSVYGYKVTLAVPGATPVSAVVNAATTAVPMGSVDITEDLTLAETMVTIEAVSFPTFKTATAFTVNGADFTVTFDRAIELDSTKSMTTTLTGAAITNVSVSGDTLSFTASGATFAADGNIVIVAGLVTSAVEGEDGNANKAITLSFDQDGNPQWSMA